MNYALCIPGRENDTIQFGWDDLEQAKRDAKSMVERGQAWFIKVVEVVDGVPQDEAIAFYRAERKSQS